MLKKHEIGDPNSCLNRAADDEPVFVLLGRDASAPRAVRQWVLERLKSGKNKHTDHEIVEADELAKRMDAYRNAWEEEVKAAKDRVRQGEWVPLPDEPCRFCNCISLGIPSKPAVHFLKDDGPEGRDGHQVCRCENCGRSWAAGSSTA